MNKTRYIDMLKDLATRHQDSSGLDCAVACLSSAPRNLSNDDTIELFKSIIQIVAKEVNLYHFAEARKLIELLEIEVRKLQ